ncbi:MAG: GNAT family N-acetyltransferase [Xanthomonadales bacterium]|nr:GNAT family N-acetyltransferase [Xanthomonadales bacterium]
MRRRVALLVYPDVEVLDFAGPFEVFSVASELHGHDLFEVRLVAERPGPVIAVNGLQVFADAGRDEVSPAQVLIVPGGSGSRRVAGDPAWLDWLRARAGTAEAVLSVCTGARAMAAAGLLAGRRFTTHHQAWDELGQVAGATLVRGVRYTSDGPLVCAAGISAGIDAALHVVARLAGETVAAATACYMEYDWRYRLPEWLPQVGGLDVRYATPDDIGAVVALAHSAYRGEASRAGWTTEADFLDGQRTDAEAVAAMLAGGQAVLLAHRQGMPVGCCHIAREGDDCWFGLFAVAPGLQGQGIGDALLAEAERRAWQDFDARRMRMKVIWLRDSLISWYLRRGYADTGRSHPFPYGQARFGVPLRDDLHFIELEKGLPDRAAGP